MKRPTSDTSHQAVAVGATAQSLLQLGVTLHKNTTHVLIAADTAEIRYTAAGPTTPTAVLGFALRTTADNPTELTVAEASEARFITATAATLQVSQLSES